MAVEVPPSAHIALAFVGTVVPDTPQYRTEVFNRAGNNFQFQLIHGLERSGVRDIEVLSARPMAAYPRGSTLWVSPDHQQFGRIPVKLLAFPNVTPLKQAVIGLNVLVSLWRWGWRKRNASHRVVFTYNLTVPPGAFTLLGARLARARAMVSVNDINIPGQTVPASPLWHLDVWLQRQLLPRFDGYVAVADEIATDFFPGRPYLRIEGGVDVAFLERTSHHAQPDPNAFVLGFAGSLNEANGVPLVLESFKSMPSADLRLRIAGSGPLQAMVIDAARHDARIEYVGMVDADGVAELYRHADLLLNVRVTRTIDTRYFFPSKLIECLASGVPTITTRVAHVGKEFTDLAYVLEDESAEGLAKLVRLVASRSREERTALARKARAYVMANLTWDAQAAKLIAYLRRFVLADRPEEDALQRT